MQKFFALDNTAVEKVGTGQRISIIENGFHTWTDLIIHGIHIGTRVLITLIYVLWVFADTSVWYAVGFVIVFVSMHLFALYISKLAIPYKKERIEIQHSYNAQLVKMIMSKFEILQSNKIAHEISIMDTMADACTANNKSENNYLFFINNVPIMLIYTMKIGIYALIGYAVIGKTATMSQLVGALVLIGLLETVINDSIDYYRQLSFNFSMIEKLRDQFDGISTMESVEKGPNYIYKKGDICLTDVTFGYDTGKPVFEKFNLQITGGTKTALVGESGGGKTTLMKLIAGYIQPDSGSVQVDGQQIPHQSLPLSRESVATVNLQSYYRHIGYLTQEPSVFDGTIYENLVYGLPTETVIARRHDEAIHGKQKTMDRHAIARDDGQLHAVITAACCQFIYDLPEGIYTEIGERGVRLSGGQKQRLAIAKIMLKNPNIILLDEPTSALDSMNEELVSQALHNLFRNKTVIVIAHRLQTVKNADRILYIGRCPIPLDKEGIEGDLPTNTSIIIEQGTHDQLVAQSGHYKRMLDLQSGF